MLAADADAAVLVCFLLSSLSFFLLTKVMLAADTLTNIPSDHILGLILWRVQW